MIKINVSEESKAKIRQLVWNDAITASTGIVNELEKDDVKAILRKYEKLYIKLYDDSDDVNEEQVKKLLLSDRDGLKVFIDEIGIIDNDENDVLLKKVFRFDNFASRKVSYNVIKLLKTDVCPYCNRQYIVTISSGKVRAQFDHYYPKDMYPYLALSVFNLVPCCSICNTSKSDLNTVNEPILYPYEEEFGYEVNFSVRVNDRKENYVKVIQGLSDAFDVIIENHSIQNADKVERQLKRLHLSELYNEHKLYIKDLYRNKYINTPERMAEIQRSFPDLFDSIEEIRGVLYLTDLNKQNWGKRPLAKLTYDIDKYDPE